jgi:DNA-directed RNA polymerase subunit RPC12/RpoP
MRMGYKCDRCGKEQQYMKSFDVAQYDEAGKCEKFVHRELCKDCGQDLYEKATKELIREETIVEDD